VEGSDGHPQTQFKGDFRINILKPIRFLQGIVVKESEKQVRESYGDSNFVRPLKEKIY
jgi:hypothetical protein